MPRRKDLSYEPVGDSLFRSRDEIEQEQDSADDARTARTHADTHARTPEQIRTRQSYTHRYDQVLALERLQLYILETTGKKPTKSELAEEAFDLLISKHNA